MSHKRIFRKSYSESNLLYALNEKKTVKVRQPVEKSSDSSAIINSKYVCAKCKVESSNVQAVNNFEHVNDLQTSKCEPIASGHSNESFTADDDEMRALSTLLAESISDAIDVKQTFEINEDIFLLLPNQKVMLPRSNCQEVKQMNKIFNMRIKDELRIDLKEESPSLGSIQFVDGHHIYPIEELTETSSSSKSVRKAKQKHEHLAQLEQVDTILSSSKAKGLQRPPTRRPVMQQGY